MSEYRRRIREQKLNQLFEDFDADNVLNWLSANDGRRPVVLVGAGFSRNAVLRKSGKFADTLPLWGDLVERLRAELPDCKVADPGSIGDLHSIHRSPGRFNQLLLNMVEDDELLPGAAHRALLAYDAEAIITTNHLDTLLDRACASEPDLGWHRVVEDPDLSTYRPNGRTRQIIYLHGHRDQASSWIATRTQYEEIEASRPLIVARVRQLFAQHQLLAVGYSMTDPDFHLFYRRINRDMKGRQPRGLALVVERPDSATRDYWRSLNITIATFRKPADDIYEALFCRFFGAGEPRVSYSQFRDTFNKTEGLAQRNQILKEYLDDPNRDRFVAEQSGSEDFRFVYEVGASALSPQKLEALREQDAQANRHYRGQAQKESAPDRERSEEEKVPTLQHFQPPRFRGTSSRLRRLNALVEEYGWSCVAQWLALIFDRDELLEDAEACIPDALNVMSWASCKGQSGQRPPQRREAIERIKRCWRYASQYDLPEKKYIGEDLAAVGASDEPPPIDEDDGIPLLTNVLNHNWEAAFRDYETRFEIAEQTRDILGIWLAAEGRAEAHARRIGLHRWNSVVSDAERQRQDDYRNQATNRKKHSTVRQWLETAEKRKAAIVELTLDDLRNRLGDGEHRVERMRFNNAPHFAWRLWRDLSSRAAWPQLQAEFLKPILDHTRLGSDLGRELRIRIALDTEKTREWVDELLTTPCEDHIKRDAEVLAACRVGATATLSERLKTIEILGVAAYAATGDDAAWMKGFVLDPFMGTDASKRTEVSVNVFYQGRAALSVASVLPGSDGFEFIKTAAATTGVSREVVRSLDQVRWYGWLLTGDVAVRDALSFIVGLPSETKDTRATAAVVGAVANILIAARDLKLAIPRRLLVSVVGWLRGHTTGEPDRHTDLLQDAAEAAAGVTSLGAPLNPATLRVCNAILDKAMNPAPAPEWEHKTLIETTRMENVSRVLSAFLGEHKLRPHFETPAQNWLEVLRTNWDSLLVRHLKLNPHHAGAFARFLMAASGRLEPARVRITDAEEWAMTKVFELVQMSTRLLPILAPLVGTRLRRAEVQIIEGLLTESGLRAARADWLMSVADFAREVAVQGGNRPPRICERLPGILLGATGDQDGAVVNHAAYASIVWNVKFAARLDVITMIERLQNDPRLMVRHAAAYGAIRLRSAFSKGPARTRLDAVDSKLATDKNLVVQNQRARAHAELQGR